MERLSHYYDGIYSHPGKPLREHLEKVGEIAKFYAKMLPISFIDKRIFQDLVQLIGLYHDIGKATPFFQDYLREKDPDKQARLKNMDETRHSLISAVATYFAVEEYLEKNKTDNEYTGFFPIASFLAVRRHHTNLHSALDDIKLDKEEFLEKQIRNLFYDYLNFLPHWHSVYKKLINLKWPLKKFALMKILKDDEDCLLYTIQHLIYSLLLDSDKHEVAIGSFLNRKHLPFDMIETYRIEKGFDKLRRPIHILRNEIYQKVINQINNIDINKERIFSLSAPTGSGKTLTALDFAMKLREKIFNKKGYYPRIIYSLPFLSIIDQNANVIEEAFQSILKRKPTNDLFLIHHHLSDYTYKEKNNEYSAQQSEIFIEGWDSEIVITTFVQFFHTLFSNQNSAIRKFHKIVGSIVILDEIQSFPPQYWLLFKRMAESMGKYLNTYFILSTATLPAIFDVSRELLLDKEKYFESFRRNRLAIKISLPKTICEFTNEFVKKQKENPKNTLIILNTVNCAEEFYKIVKKELKNNGFKIFYLSSHIVPIERLERIKEIKQTNQKKIVISTQLVEAGVDIDLEKVIRDLGPLDSIIQSAGRANRELNINLGEVEIILLKDEKNNRSFYSYIYAPVLIDATEEVIKHSLSINEDRLLELCNKYYQEVQKRISDDTAYKYLEAIKNLNYEKIREFRLIEEKGEKVDIFVELDDGATKVWEKYQEVVRVKDPIKRREKFLKIRSNFYQYVISILLSKAKENLPAEISGIRFIPKPQLEEFYDFETGFKPKSETLMW